MVAYNIQYVPARFHFETNCKRSIRILNENEIATAAFFIGRSYQAIRKKPFEAAAVVGIKNAEARRLGAAARIGKIKPTTAASLVQMRQLVASAQSVRSAAALAHKQGLGASAGASRKL